MINDSLSIDACLQSFQKFGVNLGLERILTLLADLGNPHKSIPMIHIGGTNGKGSVCAYLSAILTEAGYKVGRYTSPHLIDWTERICINNQPISQTQLTEILLRIQTVLNTYSNSPTQFEVITAAAWLYFAQEKVDIAVMEVGLGGRLDATNVCDSPLVSVITSISREHWQYLGDTIESIAREKAGILKFGCHAVIGQLPDDAETVFRERIHTLACPSVWVKSAMRLQNNQVQYQEIKYTLPLLGNVQLNNSAIAIETIKILQQEGWKISSSAIKTGINKTRWPGRLQWVKWQGHPILVDGAHNGAAAKMLRDYVNGLDKAVTWVMGMLATKDHDKIFKELLKSDDKLYVVPVPDYDSPDLKYLTQLAIDCCPDLAEIRSFDDVFAALETAITNQGKDRLIIVCGSLYLVGHFLKQITSTDY